MSTTFSGRTSYCSSTAARPYRPAISATAARCFSHAPKLFDRPPRSSSPRLASRLLAVTRPAERLLVGRVHPSRVIQRTEGAHVVDYGRRLPAHPAARVLGKDLLAQPLPISAVAALLGRAARLDRGSRLLWKRMGGAPGCARQGNVGAISVGAEPGEWAGGHGVMPSRGRVGRSTRGVWLVRLTKRLSCACMGRPPWSRLRSARSPVRGARCWACA